MSAAVAAAFASTERMSDGVHGFAANMRPFAQPAAPAGFTFVDRFMFNIAQPADGGAAVAGEAAHFTARQD